MKKVCILVGSAAISGGTYVIAQHASVLQKNGFKVTLAVQESFTAETLSWHDELPELRCIPFREAVEEEFDLVIATWWKTALELPAFKSKRHGYFVQSIESLFYPQDEFALRRLVDSTYDLPVCYVTEASWIRRHLDNAHGRAASLVRNGIRKDVYTANGPFIQPREQTKVRVLVEGHFGVPFKNTALALKVAKAAEADQTWVLTGSPVKWLPGVARVFSRVPMVETPRIYRSCDILIKLSTVEGMFGPPLEMFHCGGTAIVFDVNGADEYIADGVNAVVVRNRSVESAINALRGLLSDKNQLERLKKGALQTAAEWPSWDTASAGFVDWVQQSLESSPTDVMTCRNIVDAAWRRYTADEASVRKRPSLVQRLPIRALLKRLPNKCGDMIRNWEALVETSFGSLRVR